MACAANRFEQRAGVIGVGKCINVGGNCVGGSANAPGVVGKAEASGVGVYGSSVSGTGVGGQSSTGIGVHGTSTSWVGVWGSSVNNSECMLRVRTRTACMPRAARARAACWVAT